MLSKKMASVLFSISFEQHHPPAPLGLTVLFLHLHAGLLAHVQHPLLDTRASHLQILHGRERLLTGSLGSPLGSLVTLPGLWLNEKSSGEMRQLVKHGAQSEVSMVKVHPHCNTEDANEIKVCSAKL